MTLRGIDVSGWNGWPFNAVTERFYGSSDFLIVKATQGTWYVNPHFDKAMARGARDGKLLGFYHYAEGGSPAAEATFLYKVARAYDKKAVPVLDWEAGDNRSWGSTTWVKAFCTTYHELSGVWPMVYVQASAVYQAASASGKCALWVAGYPDLRQSWNVPGFMYSIAPWAGYAIWQYSSGGGSIDLNTANLTKEGWKKLAGNSKKEIRPQEPGKAVNDAGMFYRLHVMNLGWLSSVRDGQVAGTVGNAYQAEALKITPPEGMVLDVKLHSANAGWKTYKGVKRGKSSGEGSSPNDPLMGSVGRSQGIQAIEIDVVENPKGLKLKYRVHVAGYGWGPWVKAGYTAGTTGIDRPIEAIQIVAE